MNRGPRSFRYGPRLKLTIPLGLMFGAVAVTMSYLATHTAGEYMRIFDAAVAALGALLAVGMLRAAIGRARGRRRVVLGTSELTAPSSSGRAREVTIRYRDIKKLDLGDKIGFDRVLTIHHADGELAIAGVMLGSTGELDEIHGLLKAARKR